MKKIRILVWAVMFLLVWPEQAAGAVHRMENIVYTTNDDWELDSLVDLGEFQSEEIQDFLDALSGETLPAFSFQEIMGSLIKGDLMGVFETGAASIKASLFAELRTNAGWMGQIVVLAIIGAIFSGFAGMFGSGHVSETGFYVVYLLVMALLAASFFSSVTIASQITTELLKFMQVLLPAYFMAVAMAGGALTSAAICGFTIGTIGLVQSILGQILLPLMRIYMMLILAGNLYKEDMLSKLTELLGHAVVWTCKTLFGVVVGFHVIQGLILPQADALKNASAMRLAQMIPGFGGGVGAVSQIVLGSGILIKNTAGAAAVVILLFLAAVPMVKLLVLMVLYYLAAAAMQPVCDKRLVACMTGTAVGHGLLLKIVGYSLALFAATIAVICVSTNAVWYAG